MKITECETNKDHLMHILSWIINCQMDYKIRPQMHIF